MTDAIFIEWGNFKSKERIEYTKEEANYIKSMVSLVLGRKLIAEKYYPKSSLDFWISKVDNIIGKSKL